MSLRFDRPNNQYVDFGTTTTFRFMHGADDRLYFRWTLCMRYKAVDFSDQHTLFATTHPANGALGVHIMLITDRSMQVKIYRGVAGSGPSDPVNFVINFGSSAGIYPNDGAYHHIAITFDNSVVSNQLSIYIDGTLAAQGSTTGNTPSTLASNNVGRIGMSHLAATYNANGYLEDFRIYKDTVLPANEIMSIAQGHGRVPEVYGEKPFWYIGGASEIDRTVYKFGAGSLKCVGSQNFIGYIQSDGSLPSKYMGSVDWSFGTNDFTIEYWVRFDSVNQISGQLGVNSGLGDAWSVYQDGLPLNKIYFYYVRGGTYLASYSANWSPAISTWYHIAWVRNGSTMYLFINGVSQTLTTVTSIGTNDLAPIGGSLGVGYGLRPSDAYRDMDGNIDEVRLSNVARWTSNFTPSAVQYTMDDNTKLLLHCEHSHLKEYSGNDRDIIQYGGVRPTTAQKRFGSLSLPFDGSSAYLTLADNADWYFGTGDFTIDCWVRWNAIPSAAGGCVVAGQWVNATNYWSVDCGSDDKIYIIFKFGGNNKGVYNTTAAYSWQAGVWYHVAFVRNGANAAIYVNGVAQALTTVTSFSTNDVGDLASTLYIGQRGDGNYYLNGWIDELRISKGIARWTADFTPPSNRYTTDGNTKLLLRATPYDMEERRATPNDSKLVMRLLGNDAHDNAPAGDIVLLAHCDGTNGSTTFTDSSSRGRALTAVGNAQISTAQSKFGGASGLLDGNGDYVYAADSADWAFGTGDFTIDLWLRRVGNSSGDGGNAYLVSQRADANNWWGLGQGTPAAINFFAVSGGVTVADYQVNSVIPTGSWCHIAVVRNGSSLKLYINGVDAQWTVTTSISTNAMPDVAASLLIGALSAGAGYFLNGYIDELRITKNGARWLSDFTVPYTAYRTEITDSGLLGLTTVLGSASPAKYRGSEVNYKRRARR